MDNAYSSSETIFLRTYTADSRKKMIVGRTINEKTGINSVKVGQLEEPSKRDASGNRTNEAPA